MHPVTNYKASKNKTNKTRQYRTLFLNKQNSNNNNNKTHTHTQNTHTHTHTHKRKWDEITRPHPVPFHFKRNINQSYDQKDAISLIT